MKVGTLAQDKLQVCGVYFLQSNVSLDIHNYVFIDTFGDKSKFC